VLTGALEAPGSALLGKDAGVLAGITENGIKLRPTCGSCRPMPTAFWISRCPRHHRQCRNRRERGLVHVIGTTGLSASDDAVIRA